MAAPSDTKLIGENELDLQDGREPEESYMQRYSAL